MLSGKSGEIILHTYWHSARRIFFFPRGLGLSSGVERKGGESGFGQLLNLDLGASRFDLLLDLRSFFLRHTFLDRFRRPLDQGLCFRQA